MRTWPIYTRVSAVRSTETGAINLCCRTEDGKDGSVEKREGKEEPKRFFPKASSHDQPTKSSTQMFYDILTASF